MNEMRKQQLSEAHTWVRAELDRCVDFWLKNGMDPEFGGVYTCLDRTGKIYSTDKSVWMQGRCGWIFAHHEDVFAIVADLAYHHRDSVQKRIQQADQLL